MSDFRSMGAAYAGYMRALRQERHNTFSSGPYRTSSARNKQRNRASRRLCRQPARTALYCSEPERLRIFCKMLCKMPAIRVAAVVVAWSSALVATDARARALHDGMEKLVDDFDAGRASAPGPASAGPASEGPEYSIMPGVHAVHAWPWPIAPGQDRPALFNVRSLGNGRQAGRAKLGALNGRALD